MYSLFSVVVSQGSGSVLPFSVVVGQGSGSVFTI